MSMAELLTTKPITYVAPPCPNENQSRLHNAAPNDALPAEPASPKATQALLSSGVLLGNRHPLLRQLVPWGGAQQDAFWTGSAPQAGAPACLTSDVHGLHAGCRITSTGCSTSRHLGRYARHIVGRDGHVQRSEILLEPLDVAGPGDGDDIVPLRQQPGERELGGRAALLPGYRFDLRNEFPVAREILGLEPWMGGAAPVDIGHALDGTR